MFNILLYVGQQEQNLELIFWALGILVAIILLVALVWQRRTGNELEEELQQLETQKHKEVEFDFVLKAMGMSVWHLNADTGEVFYDKDFREKHTDFVEATEGDTYDENADLLVEEDAVRVRKALDELCAGVRDHYHEQYRIRAPHSSKVYWEESYAIIADRDINGKPLRIVGTSLRIDSRKNLETALKQALSKAEESDRLKSAFIANMSHEIRTPLNAIIGFTSVLPDIEDHDERQELINLIQENNSKLLRIIDDVMNISKIEAGKEQLQMALFDVNVILDELVNRYQSQVAGGVTISTDFAAPHQEINSDLNRVLTSMEHLVSNAVKFTTHGSIVVGYDAVADHRIRLWVRDTGKGVAPEDQERIFERFYKVDEFVPGAGLGLSLCRTMAFSLGGNVGVQSEYGKGSTFWMEIPA
jgi:signal transduction histidine kinase